MLPPQSQNMNGGVPQDLVEHFEALATVIDVSSRPRLSDVLVYELPHPSLSQQGVNLGVEMSHDEVHAQVVAVVDLLDMLADSCQFGVL